MIRPYPFSPIQSTEIPSVLSIEDAFNAEEVDRIEDLCGRLKLEEGRVGGAGRIDPSVRKAQVTWLSNDASWSWLYKKMQGFMATLNCYYRFDVWGFKESIQYSEYSLDGQFNWHVDGVVPLASPRKISASLQLSHADSYEGGALQIFGTEHVIAPRTRGALIAFPSHTLHRVSPVTRGLRKSLVCCAVGPNFK